MVVVPPPDMPLPRPAAPPEPVPPTPDCAFPPELAGAWVFEAPPHPPSPNASDTASVAAPPRNLDRTITSAPSGHAPTRESSTRETRPPTESESAPGNCQSSADEIANYDFTLDKSLTAQVGCGACGHRGNGWREHWSWQWWRASQERARPTCRRSW